VRPGHAVGVPGRAGHPPLVVDAARGVNGRPSTSTVRVVPWRRSLVPRHDTFGPWQTGISPHTAL
jgi:hypothetical protein